MNASGENIKIALFDMDGVLFGYAQRLAEEINKIKHPSEPIYTYGDFGGNNPDFMENRRALITKSGDFWENLDKLADGMFILNTCIEIGFTPHILTKGPYTKPEAWSHKLKCIHKNLSQVEQIGVNMVTSKGYTYGRILVDDWPEFCYDWLKNRPRGTVIMPARPWNKDVNHPQIVRLDLGFDPDNYGKLLISDEEFLNVSDILKRVLKEAYQR